MNIQTLTLNTTSVNADALRGNFQSIVTWAGNLAFAMADPAQMPKNTVTIGTGPPATMRPGEIYMDSEAGQIYWCDGVSIMQQSGSTFGGGTITFGP